MRQMGIFVLFQYSLLNKLSLVCCSVCTHYVDSRGAKNDVEFGNETEIVVIKKLREEVFW